MKEKYVIRDFHPLVFFYVLGTLMTLVGLLVGIEVTIRRFGGHQITTPTIVLVALLRHLGHPVHPVCDVVRPGVQQGPALSGFSSRSCGIGAFIQNAVQTRRCLTATSGNPLAAGDFAG